MSFQNTWVMNSTATLHDNSELLPKEAVALLVVSAAGSVLLRQIIPFLLIHCKGSLYSPSWYKT